MRRCGICKGKVRWDDPLQWTQGDGGPSSVQLFVGLWGAVPQGTVGGLACRYCAAKMEGRAPPPPKLYPVEADTPKALAGFNDQGTGGHELYPICCMCRQALYEGDNSEMIRVYPEDLGLPADDEQRVQTLMGIGDKASARAICAEHGAPMPGAYFACPECVQKYRPAILRRLQQSHPRWFPPEATPADVQGDWMM